jgi:hypothetical protein
MSMTNITDIHQFHNLDTHNKLLELRMAILQRLRVEEPTLRDQFAMAALAQVLSETTWEKIGETGQYHPHYVLVAEMSYKIADAMLAARERRTE